MDKHAALRHIATSEQLWAMYHSARDTFARTSEIFVEDHSSHTAAIHFEAARDAIRFVASAAAALRDPALLPLVLGALDAVERFDSYASRYDVSITSALAEIIVATPTVTAEIEALAGHSHSRARLSLASCITLESPAALPLLERLSLDPDPDVRTSARKRLASVRPLTWWTGKFSRDPLELVGPTPPGTLQTALATIGELLDLDRYALGKRLDELRRVVAQLPDRAAFDFLAVNMRSMDAIRWGWAPILADILSRPGSEEPFIRLLEAWHASEVPHLLCEGFMNTVACEMPAEHRTALSLALFDHALEMKDPRQRGDISSLPRFVADAAAGLWGPDSPPEPLLDRVLAGAAPTEALRVDFTFHSLVGALKKTTSVDAIAGRLTELLVAGFPNESAFVATTIEELLARSQPATLRAAAELASRSEHLNAQRWGYELLFDAAYDPERDPPREEWAAHLYETSPVGKQLAKNELFGAYIIHMERAALARGELDYASASSLLFRISRLARESAERAEVAARARAAAVDSDAEAANETGPSDASIEKKPTGIVLPSVPPITTEEWDRWRDLRDEAGKDDPIVVRLTIHLLPPGPLHPRDRAMLDRIIALTLRGDFEIGAYCIGPILAEHGTREDLAILEAIRPHTAPLFIDSLNNAEDKMRARFGLPPIDRKRLAAVSRAADAEVTDGGSTEWMDEPEGDE